MGWWKLLFIACHVLEAMSDSHHGLQEQLETQCGMENMQIIVPKRLKGDFKLKVLNKERKMEHLKSNPSCGIWVVQKLDGSVVIGASYDGCYISQTDTDFVLTLGFTTKEDGKRKVNSKDMTCAIETYHDSPDLDQCDAITRPNRLSCVSSQDSCATMGCCYDSSDFTTPCYYGNKVTARCTPDGLFSIAIPKTLTLPELDLNSVQLLGQASAECNPVARNGFFLLFLFPVSSCGTTLKMIGEQMVYENQLVGIKDPLTLRGISVSRDSTFRLLVRCSFAFSGFLPLKVDVVTLPPPPPVSSEGPLEFELRISLDSTYARYYTDSDYPVTKVLREPVYVEVRILQRSDPKLVLVLHQCWATPSPYPLNAIQWPILVNGCPFTGDNYKSELIPVTLSSAVDFPSHYSWFDMKTFTFVDQNRQQPLAGQVYIHCSVSACVPSPSDSCTTRCSRSRRSAYMVKNESRTVLVSSPVPIYFENSMPEAQNDSEGVYGVGISQQETLISSAAIAMGILAMVLLTGITWTLHRQQKSKSVLVSKCPSVQEKCVRVETISATVTGLGMK